MLHILYIDPSCRDILAKHNLLTEMVIRNWSRGQKIVQKRYAEVFLADLPDVGKVLVKRYVFDLRKPSCYFRRNYAVREFNGSMAMARLGIRQPQPIYVAQIKNGLGLATYGIYMMRFLPEVQGLDKLLLQWNAAEHQQELAAIALCAKRVLATLHAGGFCHWDFKPRNLLVGGNLKTGFEIIPIDARSGRYVFFWNRRFGIHRDLRYLKAEPMLAPFFKKNALPTVLGFRAGQNIVTADCVAILRRLPRRRTVYDAVLSDGRPAVIKRFEDVFGWFRLWRERHNLQRLANLGIPTPNVFYTAADQTKKPILVLEKIPSNLSAEQAIADLTAQDQVQRIFCPLARLLAQLNAAGGAHHDLHLGNFLIWNERIYCIDAAKIRFASQPLAKCASLRQLGGLLMLARALEAPHQTQIARAYFAQRGWQMTDADLSAAFRYAQDVLSHRLPKALARTTRDSKLVFVAQTPLGKGFFNRALFKPDDVIALANLLAQQPFTAVQPSLEIAYKNMTFKVFYYVKQRRLMSLFNRTALKDWHRLWSEAIAAGKADQFPAALINPVPDCQKPTSWLVVQVKG